MACIKEKICQNVIILSTNFLWPHRPQKAPEHVFSKWPDIKADQSILMIQMKTNLASLSTYET